MKTVEALISSKKKILQLCKGLIMPSANMKVLAHSCVQANVQHSKSGQATLVADLVTEDINLIFITEPYFGKAHKLPGIPREFTSFIPCRNSRVAILARDIDS